MRDALRGGEIPPSLISNEQQAASRIMVLTGCDLHTALCVLHALRFYFPGGKK